MAEPPPGAMLKPEPPKPSEGRGIVALVVGGLSVLLVFAADRLPEYNDDGRFFLGQVAFVLAFAALMLVRNPPAGNRQVPASPDASVKAPPRVPYGLTGAPDMFPDASVKAPPRVPEDDQPRPGSRDDLHSPLRQSRPEG